MDDFQVTGDDHLHINLYKHHNQRLTFKTLCVGVLKFSFSKRAESEDFFFFFNKVRSHSVI